MKKTTTYSQKASEVSRDWHIIDASTATLGRITTIVATHLIGKHKPTYTPSMDAGDHVIVINADKLRVTGNKLETKVYYRHSQYPGGLKEATLQEKMATNPEFVIQNAVRGMLPKNKLQDERMKRLHVYAGTDHKHDAQKPATLEVK